MHALSTCNVHTYMHISFYIYIYIIDNFSDTYSSNSVYSRVDLRLFPSWYPLVVSFDVASIACVFHYFASTRCIQLQPVQHHCLFVAPPPWSTIPLRPLHFFFPRQRDFFIPARYPRGLDSLTLRGQKKEEGGGEKKGAERDRGREREEKICHDLSSSEQKCSLPLKRPLKPSRVNLFSCSGFFFFSLLFSPPPSSSFFSLSVFRTSFADSFLSFYQRRTVRLKLDVPFERTNEKKKKNVRSDRV